MPKLPPDIKMTYDPINAIPQSNSVRYLRCGFCPNVHILLEDDFGEPMAICVMSEEMLRNALIVCLEAKAEFEKGAGGVGEVRN